MSSTEEWLLRPDGLARRLRELRREGGITGQVLAERLGWTQPRISKIENGKQLPSAEDVEAFARACGADDEAVQDLLREQAEASVIHQEWRQRVRSGQPQIQFDYDLLAQRATVIRNAETLVVPGLLQTPGYARAMATQNVLLHGADPDEVDDTVAARMRRQNVLYDTSKRFEFLVTEAALRHSWCSPTEMRNQLDRLISVTIEREHIWFGVIPFVAAEVPKLVAQTPFIIFDDLAIVESYRGEDGFRGEDGTIFARAMDLLKAEAVTGDEARALIVRAMENLPR